MNLTLTVDDDVVQRAQKHAEDRGTSVDELLRSYLEQLGKTDYDADTAEFIRLSTPPQGDSKGWKFNREEIHERR